jgi:transposase
MKLHRKAALSWRARRELAERVVIEGWAVRAAAEAANISVRCCRKWVGRYRLDGEAGLFDRSSAPKRVGAVVGIARGDDLHTQPAWVA